MAKAEKGNQRAKKKAIPAKRKTPVAPTPMMTKFVITTQINGRQQFISRLSTNLGGKRFIPHYTSNRDDAKDFLSEGMAQQYIDAIFPIGIREFNIEMIDVPFHKSPVDPAGDGPNYEMTITAHVESKHFLKPNTTRNETSI